MKDVLVRKRIKVPFISNVVFEPYLSVALKEAFSNTEYEAIVSYIPYTECMESVNQNKLDGSHMILVCLNFNELCPETFCGELSDGEACQTLIEAVKHRCLDFYANLRRESAAPIVWFGFEDYCCRQRYVFGELPLFRYAIDRLNAELCDTISEQDVYIDFKRMIAQIGIGYAYDNKGRYRWNAPYSKALLCLLSEEICKQYLIHIGQTKKCIVLDCDNVLWGGVLSEDGIEKLHLGDGLGRAYQDFQRFLVMLYRHGVILTVCSKNDEVDVLRMFREHSGMVLKEEHIACFKVNWDNKVENIRALSEELNISLDSMVFVDDSEFEIGSVRTMLPEVTAILYDRNTVYQNLSCFHLRGHTDLERVRQRNETYRTNLHRKQLQSQSKSFDEYLRALEIRVDIHEALPMEFARISELTQRTNKCTNGIRYSVDQLKQRVAGKGYQLFSVTVSDKYATLGIVGALGIYNGELDLFSLSCRALGRNIERQMLEFVKVQGALYYQFKSTNKNNEINDILSRAFEHGC